MVWERYDGGASLTDIYGRLVTGTASRCNLRPSSTAHDRLQHQTGGERRCPRPHPSGNTWSSGSCITRQGIATFTGARLRVTARPIPASTCRGPTSMNHGRRWRVARAGRSTLPCGSDRTWRRWPSSTSTTGASIPAAQPSAGMPGCWAALPRDPALANGLCRRSLRRCRGQTAAGRAGHLRPTLGGPELHARHPQAVKCEVDRTRMAQDWADQSGFEFIRGNPLDPRHPRSPSSISRRSLCGTGRVPPPASVTAARPFRASGRPGRSARWLPG